MAKDKLVVESDREGYYIVWYLAEIGDLGAILGEETYTEAQLAKAGENDWEHIKATVVASKMSGVKRHGHSGYRWESAAKAVAALRAVKAALKDKSKKPWPAWALEAKAAGWKPPKGWTP